MYFHQKWSRSCIRKPVPGVMEFVILEYTIFNSLELYTVFKYLL